MFCLFKWNIDNLKTETERGSRPGKDLISCQKFLISFTETLLQMYFWPVKIKHEQSIRGRCKIKKKIKMNNVTVRADPPPHPPEMKQFFFFWKKKKKKKKKKWPIKKSEEKIEKKPTVCRSTGAFWSKYNKPWFFSLKNYLGGGIRLEIYIYIAKNGWYGIAH